MVASLSAESASLAAVQAARRRTTPRATSGSLPSSSGELAADDLVHMGEHGVVEVDPAEALQPLGGSQQLGLVAAADDGDVEGAAAEVVHGDQVAGRDPAQPHVVQGGGLRLAEQGDRVEPGDPARLAEQVELVAAPGGRVGRAPPRRAPIRPARWRWPTTWASTLPMSASAP